MSWGGLQIYVVECGTGGTFQEEVKENSHALGDIRYIGTEQCIETVGVYFEIDGGRCFCANIAFPEFNATTKLDSVDRRDLSNQVTTQLTFEAESAGWTVDMVSVETLTITCAHYDSEASKSTIVAVVAHAVYRFLDINESVVWNGHGFVREPGIRSITKELLWDEEKDEAQHTLAGLCYNTHKHESLVADDWSFRTPT